MPRGPPIVSPPRKREWSCRGLVRVELQLGVGGHLRQLYHCQGIFERKLRIQSNYRNTLYQFSFVSDCEEFRPKHVAVSVCDANQPAHRRTFHLAVSVRFDYPAIVDNGSTRPARRGRHLKVQLELTVRVFGEPHYLAVPGLNKHVSVEKSITAYDREDRPSHPIKATGH